MASVDGPGNGSATAFAAARSEKPYPVKAHSGKTTSRAPASAASASRVLIVARFPLRSPRRASICTPATFQVGMIVLGRLALRPAYQVEIVNDPSGHVRIEPTQFGSLL